MMLAASGRKGTNVRYRGLLLQKVLDRPGGAPGHLFVPTHRRHREWSTCNRILGKIGIRVASGLHHAEIEISLASC
jgi:hypothetical protein